MRILLVCYSILSLTQVSEFQELSLKGQLLASHSKAPIPNAKLYLDGTLIRAESDTSGKFHLKDMQEGTYMLRIVAVDFIEKRFAVELINEEIDLGIIYLDLDISHEQSDNLITLNDADLSDNEEIVSSAGLLQATRDIYLSRAAFDFSQAFFRIRGYDSREATVLFNGHKLNKLTDGRPQWNNWGGLNDITRNQELSFGINSSRLSFGSLLGVTNINSRPTASRPGTRLSASVANRTYRGRFMATYTSVKSEKGISYSVSGSRRWGNEGFIDGTFYGAYSIYGSLEYGYNSKNSIHLTAMLTTNKRGLSAAITDEVFNLAGHKYNPYWGYQNGAIRNSRVRNIKEPIFMFNHYHSSDKLRIQSGIAYQFGSRTKSRLGYYNAPNPDPTYYRYLPSYYINSPIGANFSNAALAKEGFLQHSQIIWENIYTANAFQDNGKRAAYVLYDDVVDEKLISLNSIGNLKLSNTLTLDMGIAYRRSNSTNYAKIDDLLGAQWLEDIDPFSNTGNDLNGSVKKVQGDIFNYDYAITVRETDAFLQLRAAKSKWDVFISGKLSSSSFFRDGLFLNERYPENSLGKSRVLNYLNLGIKGGLIFKISGRQWITANSIRLQRAPTFKNTFINPRENNISIAENSSEKVSSFDIGYNFRFPDLKGRLTAYYTRFQKGTDINFFFVDSGLGSDFVQEVITNLDKLHLGIEMSFKYQISSGVALTLAGSIAKYVFASDPNLSINFDPSGPDEDLISEEGYADLGIAKIKNYKLPQGPQKAYSFGLDYRDPKYWWIGMTANYLTNNYTGISTIMRTSSFFLDPETTGAIPHIPTEKAAHLLKQNKIMDFYLLNITGGKSWLRKGKYVSLFLSVNNVFNTVFKTGGYDQSRNGNYAQMARDNLSGSPLFGPKYWYGYGRTYFLNVAFSF